MRAKTACFTGHRNIPTEQYDALNQRLEHIIVHLIDRGYRFFGAGGALGFDTMAAQAVLTLKKQYTFIRLILVLPCHSQTKNGMNPTEQSTSASKSKPKKLSTCPKHIRKAVCTDETAIW